MSALTEGRGVTLSITSGTPSVEALVALAKIIEKYQTLVDEGLTTTAITGGNEVTVKESGTHPHILFEWQLEATTDPDADVFAVSYQGSSAN